MLSKAIALAAGAAVISSASAQMSYNLGGFTTQLFSFDNIRANGLPDVVDTLTPAVDEGSLVFGSDFRTFERHFVLNAEPYPTIEATRSDMVVHTQAAPDRFEFTWDASHSGEIIPPAADVTRFRQTAMQLNASITMLMTQNTTLRISWESTASGILGGGTDFMRVRNNALGRLAGTAIASPFNFGYANAGATVTDNFSFDINVVSGRTITLDLNAVLALRNEAFAEVGSSWDQASSGSFVVQVIPAPASCGLFAVAMIGALRRRR